MIAFDQSSTRTGIAFILDGFFVGGVVLHLKQKTTMERLHALEVFIDLLLERVQALAIQCDFVMESGMEYSAKSVEARKAMMAAQYTVQRAFYLADIAIGEIHNSQVKALVDKRYLQELKDKGQRINLRAMKCDVPVQLHNELGLDLKFLQDNPDLTDAIAVGMCQLKK